MGWHRVEVCRSVRPDEEETAGPGNGRVPGRRQVTLELVLAMVSETSVFPEEAFPYVNIK